MDLLALLKMARGLTGLLLASWGVYALPLVGGLTPPFREIAWSACLIAMFLGVIAAGIQVLRSVLK